MNEIEIREDYFDWMMHYIQLEGSNAVSRYSKLLRMLFSIEFTYTIPMDGNRFEDGVELRYRFGDENNIPTQIIASYLDNVPCSVLEMMIALSMRIDAHIMGDPSIGNQVDHWFWLMIRNLGLEEMTNLNYDEDYISLVIARLLNRAYEPDGQGGLFYVPGCGRDMRTIEIWYQMHAYLIYLGG